LKAIGLVVVLAALVTLPALGAKTPEIYVVTEGRGPGDLPVLVLEGKRLNKIDDEIVDLLDKSGQTAGTVGVVSPGSTTVALTLPPGLEPGVYDLVLYDRKGNSLPTLEVTLTAGLALPESVTGAALDGDFREDLDDAEGLGGRPASYFGDAGNMAGGAVDTNLLSALEDLKTEGNVVNGEILTELFSAWTDLEDEGLVDGDGDLVASLFSAWTDIKGEGYLDSNDQLPLSNFSAWSDLEAEGWVDTGVLQPTRLQAWDDLLDEGYLDGFEQLDADFFSAWSDLEAEGLVGMQEGSLAPGDHEHDGDFVELAGDTMTGSLEVTGSGLSAGEGAVSLGGPSLVLFQDLANSPVGTHATCSSTTDGSAAVLTEVKQGGTLSTATALYAKSWFGGFADVGLEGRATATSGTTYGVRLEAQGVGSNGLVTTNNGNAAGLAVEAVTRGSGGAALQVRSKDGTGDIATCVSSLSGSSVTEARIDAKGKGFFNGGTQVSGADFAESVRTRTEAESFEPGDVLVIDPEAVRGFALSREARCSLVAGVVSTKPGVLGTTHAVADPAGSATEREVPLAIVGIVPVKVTDENGAIEPGDLLVAASTPGHAMKAPGDPEPGTIIGKALDFLKDGRGKVEALLMVQ
jgi:hypothetical protein